MKKEGIFKKTQKINNKQNQHNSICIYQTLNNNNAKSKSKSRKFSIDKIEIFNEFQNFNKIQKEKNQKILIKSSSTSNLNLKETKRTSKISDSTSIGLSIKNGTISSGSNLNCGNESKKNKKIKK